MGKVKTFNSFQHLEHWVHMGMPDCYPAPMAKLIAEDMLKAGKVKILTDAVNKKNINNRKKNMEEPKKMTDSAAKTEAASPKSERLNGVREMTEKGKVERQARDEARKVRMAERAERISDARADRFDRKVVRTSDFILRMIERRAAKGKNTYTYKAGRRSRSLRRLLNEVMVELADFNPRFRGKTIRRCCCHRYYDYWYCCWRCYCGCCCCKQRHARLDFSW